MIYPHDIEGIVNSLERINQTLVRIEEKLDSNENHPIIINNYSEQPSLTS